MSIGLIGSPASWSLGTVVAPSWCQQVQDNLNGLQNGTGPTLSALQIDGTGGASSSQPAGTIGVSGTISGGGTFPNATIPRGTLYQEHMLVAMYATFSASAGTLATGVNIHGFTRNSAGNYTVTVNTVGLTTSAMIHVATVRNNSPAFITITPQTGTTLLVQTFNSSGSAADFDHDLVLWST